MSDAIDRARDIIERYLPAMPDQQAAFVTRDAARALADAGLLASPEHDAAAAAKALRRFTEAESMDLWWLASCDGWGVPEGLPKAFLTTVADFIEREAGESDADA